VNVAYLHWKSKHLSDNVSEQDGAQFNSVNWMAAEEIVPLTISQVHHEYQLF